MLPPVTRPPPRLEREAGEAITLGVVEDEAPQGGARLPCAPLEIPARFTTLSDGRRIRPEPELSPPADSTVGILRGDVSPGLPAEAPPPPSVPPTDAVPAAPLRPGVAEGIRRTSPEFGERKGCRTPPGAVGVGARLPRWMAPLLRPAEVVGPPLRIEGSRVVLEPPEVPEGDGLEKLER